MKIILLIGFFLFGFASPVKTIAEASVAAPGAFQTPFPQPPVENPHPPQSAEDKRRVDFAVQQILAKHGPKVEIRHPHIIPWSMPKPKHQGRKAVNAMAPAPQLKLEPGEFIVHAYVKFPDKPAWHHLDVILSEDGGNLTLRRFYSVPMHHPTLPKGVVC